MNKVNEAKDRGIDVTLADAARIVAKINGRCLILCHKRPDGDTLGSALALKAALEYLGKSAEIACCDAPSSNCKFLFDSSALPIKEPDAALYEAIVAVDVASGQMLGKLEYLKDKVCLKLDHHRIGESYAEYNYVDPDAAACGEVIYQLCDLLGVPDSVIAEPIYAAISSDSGSFRYSSTTRRTMQIASNTMAAGADFVKINHNLFESRTQAEVSAIKTAYDNLKYYYDGKLAIVMITNSDKEKGQFGDSELGVINSLPREICNVVLGITIKQDSDDQTRYKVSMRSGETVDVSALCAEFGGGGHLRAAGCELRADSPDEAVGKLLCAISKIKL